MKLTSFHTFLSPLSTETNCTSGLHMKSELLKHVDTSLLEHKESDKPDDFCNKDTGEKSRLRQRSRGFVMKVDGAGNIRNAAPLYKSESPSQIFLFVIETMYQELKEMPKEEWGNYVLCYDNMCNLDNLRQARHPLPLPKPYDEMWMLIKKVIDRLHIRNHKRRKCHIDYSPHIEQLEGINTMICEQTFAWLVFWISE